MIWWGAGFLVVALGIWWANRSFDAQAADNRRRAEERNALAPLDLPPAISSSQQNHSDHGRVTRSKRAYAHLYDNETKDFTPVSRDQLEDVLKETRANLVKWRRLAKRAETATDAWKVNPKLRAEIEAELPSIIEAAESVRKLLDQLYFENDSSDERYSNLWDELVGIQTDLEMNVQTLAEIEQEPKEDD